MKNKNFQTYVTSVFFGLQSLMLVLAVLLSAAHAKDIVALQPHHSRHAAVKTHGDDGSGLAKVSAELHNHVDKQHLKTFYTGDVQQHADRRLLRQLEDDGHLLAGEVKFAASVWLRLLTARLLF